MSKVSLDVWKKSLDLAGYEFETEQEFLNFVHNDPNPNDINLKRKRKIKIPKVVLQ